MSIPVTGIVANYTDPNTGANFPTAWLNIRQLNYVADQSCLVVVDVYGSQAAYEAGLDAVFHNILPIVDARSNDFTNYFSIPIMRELDHDIQTQAIAYITSIYE